MNGTSVQMSPPRREAQVAAVVQQLAVTGLPAAWRAGPNDLRGFSRLGSAFTAPVEIRR
jgi:hypothetical protein